jgi:hypothetical protein
MEWKLPDDKKSQYDGMLNGAQDLDRTIGSTQYRVHKLLDMRKELEDAIKKWWDSVIEDLKLDKDKDYMISREGTVKLVPKPGQPAPQPEAPVEQPVPGSVPGSDSNVGTNAAELK